MLALLVNQANNGVADTGILGAGPGGNPISHLLWLAKEEKRGHTAETTTIPAPFPKPTFPIFKMLSRLTRIQNTDLDMPTLKQATTLTIRAYYLMLTRKSAIPLETCPVYPHL
eukprot:1147030-Pelagomonas_calceolata.AAC.2